MALKLHSRSGMPTYLYVLTYQGAKSFGPLQRDAPQQISRDSYGVTHMDDMFYLMPNEYNPQELDVAARTVSSSLLNCVYSFIFPAGGASCPLKSYNYAEQNFLTFGPTGYPIPSNPALPFKASATMSFWNDLIYHVIEFTATPPPYFPYREFKGFQAATWSMLAFILILVLVIAALAAVLCVNKRKEQRSMKLLRSRDRELEDRYHNHSQG